MSGTNDQKQQPISFTESIQKYIELCNMLEIDPLDAFLNTEGLDPIWVKEVKREIEKSRIPESFNINIPTLTSNLLLLDIYDLTPVNEYYDKLKYLKVLKLNCKILRKICNDYNLSIITYKDENDINTYNSKVLDIISKYLSKYIIKEEIGIKEKIIKKYIQDKHWRNLIVIDKRNLSSSTNPNNNSHYIHIDGFLTPGIIHNITSILSDNF